MDNNVVITISRQYGSGGRELAQILANKLQIKLYDKQIVHMAAMQLSLGELSEAELLNMESKLSPLPLSALMPFHSFGLHFGESSTQMFLEEAEVIRKLAEHSCIILGRAADYVLRNNPNKFSIFVCANDEFRAQRGIDNYGGKSLRELNKEDAQRASYYNYYTGKTWGAGESYDLVVNTSTKPLEKIADAIIDYLKKFNS